MFIEPFPGKEHLREVLNLIRRVEFVIQRLAHGHNRPRECTRHCDPAQLRVTLDQFARNRQSLLGSVSEIDTRTEGSSKSAHHPSK